MPQVYWEQAHNPGEQLERSLAQFENLGYPLPMVPTGAAYGGSGWYPTSDDIVEFMDKAVELGMTGASFWSWDYCPFASCLKFGIRSQLTNGLVIQTQVQTSSRRS